MQVAVTFVYTWAALSLVLSEAYPGYDAAVALYLGAPLAALARAAARACVAEEAGAACGARSVSVEHCEPLREVAGLLRRVTPQRVMQHEARMDLHLVHGDKGRGRRSEEAARAEVGSGHSGERCERRPKVEGDGRVVARIRLR